MTHAKKLRGPTVAITGAGSGLGGELAFGFSTKGYHVFDTARSVNETAEFQNQSAGDGEITLTITDITKEEQVKNWKDQVKKVLNGDGLDLLINNAGVLTPGPMEVLSLNAVRREFDL
jgi:NAD(P)-dependent dehydrogenase (short-subunit alcohol dehydrogenase family)